MKKRPPGLRMGRAALSPSSDVSLDPGSAVRPGAGHGPSAWEGEQCLVHLWAGHTQKPGGAQGGGQVGPGMLLALAAACTQLCCKGVNSPSFWVEIIVCHLPSTGGQAHACPRTKFSTAGSGLPSPELASHHLSESARVCQRLTFPGKVWTVPGPRSQLSEVWALEPRLTRSCQASIVCSAPGAGLGVFVHTAHLMSSSQPLSKGVECFSSQR